MQFRQQTACGAARCRTTKSAKSTRNTFHINKERKYGAPQHAPAFEPAAGLMVDHVDGANDHASHTSAHVPYFSVSKHKDSVVPRCMQSETSQHCTGTPKQFKHKSNKTKKKTTKK